MGRDSSFRSSTMSSSNNGGIVPWIVMGLSMGVGYFGLESLLDYCAKAKSRDARTTKRSLLHQHLKRQLEQMGSLLSLSHAKTWLLRSWTVPLGGYRDVFWGVFVAVLPREQEEETTTKRLPTQRKAPSPENDVFLTLPPQLSSSRTNQLPPRLPPKASGNKKQERYLEMLLHNISHTDMVLGLEVLEKNAARRKLKPSNLNSMCLGRPRFSAFDMYCRRLLKALDSQKEEAEIVLVPQYQRSHNDARYTIQPSDRPHISTGFCWKEETTEEESNPRVLPGTEALADLRVRGKDMVKIDPYLDSYSPRPSTSSTGTAAVDMTASWSMVPPPASGEEHAPLCLSKEDILVELKAVFFPLLATLLPRWHAQIAQKYQHGTGNVAIHKVLVLVTGVGTPRNWTHSITGNSTQALADLMELFLAKVYPDITVVKIHSDTNIFRYDDNILFVQQELLPTVNAYRDAHATQSPYPHERPMLPAVEGSVNNGGFLQQLEPRHAASSPFDVDWKRSFAVTLSFADGSPARTHAIQTALRIFRPTYFHIWQLKSFWHERKIVDDDVEVHSFEEMETSPALESIEIQQGDLASVVQEMKAFKQEMTETLLGKKDSSDIHSFWLRKTHKPVLAVLLVQSPGKPPVLYRGTNMEVSMPTGSLCAERNVIGTALASNPKLKREDLKCIAVLAVPQPPKAGMMPPRPPRSASLGSSSDHCGPCSSRRNSWDESSNANAPTNNNNNTTTMTGRQMRSESFDEREEDWMLSYSNNGSQAQKPPPLPAAMEMAPSGAPMMESSEPSTPMRQISLFSAQSSNSLMDMIKQYPSPPNAKPTNSPPVKEKRTVIVRSNNHDTDLNPLRPCGACHEWLKKIAECNPYFQIVTFTDAECNGVYVTPCQE